MRMMEDRGCDCGYCSGPPSEKPEVVRDLKLKPTVPEIPIGTVGLIYVGDLRMFTVGTQESVMVAKDAEVNIPPSGKVTDFQLSYMAIIRRHADKDGQVVFSLELRGTFQIPLDADDVMQVWRREWFQCRHQCVDRKNAAGEVIEKARLVSKKIERPAYTEEEVRAKKAVEKSWQRDIKLFLSDGIGSWMDRDNKPLANAG